MKFSDIRPGYMVELRNGARFLISVIESNVMSIVGISKFDTWVDLNPRFYDEDMREKLFHNTDFDIVKVWGYSRLVTRVNDFDNPERYRTLLFDSTNTPRVLTLAEIEKLLGFRVVLKEVKE